jgi:hypothetical protein
MPLASTSQSRIRFAPVRILRRNRANIGGCVPEGKRVVRDLSHPTRGGENRRARGLRDQSALRSEEAPTLMALGGFEQLTLNP